METVNTVDTLIVGAGIGGLALGMRLLERGTSSFLILERGDDIGGTWRDNRYPGVACDIPSHLYSFSFRPAGDWSKVFASGSEILAYLRKCATDTGLWDHVQLKTEVFMIRWDDSSEFWKVTTRGGEIQAKTVVLATGRLSEPAMPDIPTLSSFPGTVLHSSTWDESVQCDGKRIAVVGSGASAVQLVPALQQAGAHVIQFQRNAPYLVPKNNRSYTDDERLTFLADPNVAKELRERLFWQAEEGYAERVTVPAFIERLRTRSLDYLARSIDDVDLRRALTPRYEIGCKRVLYSDDYYSAVSTDEVTLEPSALDCVDGDVLRAASGECYSADIIVFATGFDAAEPPIASRVQGRAGKTLAHHWREGMTAFDTTAVSGFPNMFLIDLPNAALGHNSAVFMIETQVENILGGLEAFFSSGATVLEVKAEAELEFTRQLDGRSAGTVWMQGGCSSWYVDPRSGRLTLLWPDFAYRFRDEVGTFRADAFDFRVPARK